MSKENLRAWIEVSGKIAVDELSRDELVQVKDCCDELSERIDERGMIELCKVLRAALGLDGESKDCLGEEKRGR